MPIPFTCPSCGKQTLVADQFAGQSGPCASCGSIIRVPSPSDDVPPEYERVPSLGEDAVVRMLIPVGRSGWAIAAGYAGLFAVTLVLAPLALLLGIVAVAHLKRHPEKHGLGRAWFGVVMGALFTMLLFGALSHWAAQ
jgi:hypothetical protein